MTQFIYLIILLRQSVLQKIRQMTFIGWEKAVSNNGSS
uniref:Uncharacterized protein n=1 Tax=Siphoviridae sp. ct2vX3 TaxID=2825318 RepID=A0A8S5PXD2_9CAUD|nr:MAG TPA: hypothetical protein [Siphoviridae sp. ct2vX3]